MDKKRVSVLPTNNLFTMKQRVISFHYHLTNSAGEKIDSSEIDHPLCFLEGVGQIIPGLEKELAKLNVGDKKSIQVAAADAYGKMDEKKIVQVPADKLPKNLQLGDQLRTKDDPHGMPLTVTRITDAQVTLDANHPLAGMDLKFDVEIVEIRDATKDEMAHGHAHGPGGHHHH
jgi:FKBP-type peptidyl-prolyl cis-trans isomerase SlyD